MFKCKKPNKEKMREPRICTRTYRLLEIMPLDSEVHCVVHPKETVLHYDHSVKEFKCLQCERLERLNERAEEVVETDRRIIAKSLHVLNELIMKKIAELQGLITQIG
jgi:hypothetical protein